MGKMTPQKREEMETLIYNFFSAFDKTETNTKHYQDMFSKMSDTQFDKWFKDFFDNPKAYLVLNICDYENTIQLDDIEDAAKVLNIPLFETVYMPYVTMDKKKTIATPIPVPVGYLNIKRTQQTISKKNGLSTSIDTRSALTAQVTGADKNGRESDLENTMLASLGMVNTMRELNGPRADDMSMKNQMLHDIALNGYVKLEDLDDDVENKTTLNTVNVFLLGMGLDSDLVTKGLMLPASLKDEL
jgi:hypothetical protein